MAKKISLRKMFEDSRRLHKNDKLYGTATVGAKGQVVIPAGARKDLGYASGSQLMVIGSKDTNTMVLIKSDTLDEFIAMVLKQMSGTGLEKDTLTYLQALFGKAPSETPTSKSRPRSRSKTTTKQSK